MKIHYAITALLVIFLAGCSAESTPQQDTDNALAGKIILTGSSTVAPLAGEIAKRFESLHPKVRVDVQTGGSSRGIADIRNNMANIGMVSRALTRKETDIIAFPIARDGVGIIVHTTNPVKRLSTEQIKAIYTGKIRNWQQVGGNKAPITVVNKAEGRATLDVFTTYFGLKNSEIRPDIIIGDNEQGIKTIAGNPNAIGYVSLGNAEYDANQGVKIKLLPLEGIEATTSNLALGHYPLKRVLNFVTKTEPQGLALAFIEYAQSSNITDIIRQQQFVAISSAQNASKVNASQKNAMVKRDENP